MAEWIANAGRRRALGQLLGRWLALPASAALCTSWASAAGLADQADAPGTRGTLRIALEGTYPPFNFTDPVSGQLTGYDVDVARTVATRMGLEPQFVPTEWSEILTTLRAGRVDVAISQVIITPQRANAFDFSAPYCYSQSQLIVRENERATYRTLADLKGRKLGVHQNSVFEAQARAVPGIEIKRYPAVPEKLQDLAFGRIDALLDDSLLIGYLINQTQLPLKAGARIGPPLRVGIAMRKGRSGFKLAIDKALREARADGTLRALSLKWFGHDASSMARS
ncbi:cystine transport system substrate-binding protein [Massilia sp. MP_M2]